MFIQGVIVTLGGLLIFIMIGMLINTCVNTFRDNLKKEIRDEWLKWEREKEIGRPLPPRNDVIK